MRLSPESPGCGPGHAGPRGGSQRVAWGQPASGAIESERGWASETDPILAVSNPPWDLGEPRTSLSSQFLSTSVLSFPRLGSRANNIP